LYLAIFCCFNTYWYKPIHTNTRLIHPNTYQYKPNMHGNRDKFKSIWFLLWVWFRVCLPDSEAVTRRLSNVTVHWLAQRPSPSLSLNRTVRPASLPVSRPLTESLAGSGSLRVRLRWQAAAPSRPGPGAARAASWQAKCPARRRPGGGMHLACTQADY
jgi:hypothetical protein